MLVAGIAPTHQRLKVVDFTLPSNYEFFMFLIPVPDDAFNTTAVIKPFQWPVSLSLFCIIFPSR